MIFVYLLQSMTDPSRQYVGTSNDPELRLNEHNDGRSIHTNTFKPWNVVVAIGFANAAKAAAFESHLKTGSGRAFAKRHVQGTEGALREAAASTVYYAGAGFGGTRTMLAGRALRVTFSRLPGRRECLCEQPSLTFSVMGELRDRAASAAKFAHSSRGVLVKRRTLRNAIDGAVKHRRLTVRGIASDQHAMVAEIDND